MANIYEFLIFCNLFHNLQEGSFRNPSSLNTGKYGPEKTLYLSPSFHKVNICQYCMRLLCNNQLIISTRSLFDLPEKKITKIPIFQSIKDFITHQMLTIKHISTSKENLTLFLNNQIFLSSNKIQQLLQKHQLVNYIAENLNSSKLYCLYFTSSLKNILSSLANPIAHIFKCSR